MICYWITNGRSTSKASLESLRNQAGNHKITMVCHEPVPQSFNHVLTCPEKYFSMAGDDFVLHPTALNYIQSIMKNMQPTTGMICWRLYDPVLRRSIEGIKAYNAEAVRRVGGFRLDERGKMDNNMWFDLKNAGYNNFKDARSLLGLHIHGTVRDLDRYEQQWGHVKSYRFNVMANQRSIQEQIKKGMIQIKQTNRINTTLFYFFTLKNAKKC